MSSFRTKFVPRTPITKWFPRHMFKGMLQIQSRLANVDCVLEVHDARIPYTGRSSHFHQSLISIRPHVLILNKCDLIDDNQAKAIKRQLSRTTKHIIFTDCKGGRNCRQILPTILKLMLASDRFKRSDASDIRLMCIGIPNVGKSTVINKLRQLHSDKSIHNKKPAIVGPTAGVTRNVMEKIKICSNPLVYLLDTPGILEPKNVSQDDIMKMALCSTQSDQYIGIQNIADYLLYWLNKHKHFSYVELFNLKKPYDNIDELLIEIALASDYYAKFKTPSGKTGLRPDLLQATENFINSFRTGKLGKFVLDEDFLEEKYRENVQTVYSPSDAYQESILKPIRSYSDVAIFHYSVPSQSSKASWTFIAFSDDSSCEEKIVHIYLRYGSYPVISIDNISFPENVVLPTDLDESLYYVKAITRFQPKDMPVIDILNPYPGSWFAIAFIVSDGNEAIKQQGIGKKCHYSIGSMASWNQELNVHLLMPSIPIRLQNYSEIAWFKFFVPENTFAFRIRFSENVNTLNSSVESHFYTECSFVFGISSDSLPFLNSCSNSTKYILDNDSQSLDHLVLQPRTNVYYYIGLKAHTEIDINVIVIFEECEMSFTNIDWFPASLNFKATSAQKSETSLSTHKYSDIVEKFISAKRSYSQNPPCLPILPLTRIKHAQDFLDSFMFQGKDWFSSRVSLSCKKLVYIRFEILPFIDIGGTLITKFIIDRYSQINLRHRDLVIYICLRSQRPPPYLSEIEAIDCPRSQLSMRLEFNDSQSTSTLRLIPFPKPGTWFISLQPLCYNNTSNDTQDNEDIFHLDLRIRLQPCVMENEQCGGHGFCKENHFRHFYFSSCHCTDGWKGWGCTNGISSFSPYLSLLQTLLLILSNLFFIPAIYIATKWKFYAEAIVYLATMIFSSFYHACDTENIAICIFKYDVLQFCDFYSAILSFWVTIVAMACLPLSVSSMAHMAGALGIALAVQAEKTGLWTFVVPVATGIAIMLLSWGNQCWHSKSFRLTRKLLHLIPGVAFVLTGLILFAFLETEGNYKYIHSAWHATIALSISFLLPRNQQLENATKASNSLEVCNEREANTESEAKESEMIDIAEYRLNSDLTTLLSKESS
ncbi:transmembrane protein 8B-like protein [Dinothrombium tinctorium]|uniref:Transmembrane protein 8B-like protein n=1 Tax=Dinothrombium tinctorium TaxID=1965070 RepID=A0A443REC1_9ACAR|nr:transmembrane protein 8B-like protein [Dinothrombium tinctorium]